MWWMYTKEEWCVFCRLEIRLTIYVHSFWCLAPTAEEPPPLPINTLPLFLFNPFPSIGNSSMHLLLNPIFNFTHAFFTNSLLFFLSRWPNHLKAVFLFPLSITPHFPPQAQVSMLHLPHTLALLSHSHHVTLNAPLWLFISTPQTLNCCFILYLHTPHYRSSNGMKIWYHGWLYTHLICSLKAVVLKCIQKKNRYTNSNNVAKFLMNENHIKNYHHLFIYLFIFFYWWGWSARTKEKVINEKLAYNTAPSKDLEK